MYGFISLSRVVGDGTESKTAMHWIYCGLLHCFLWGYCLLISFKSKEVQTHRSGTNNFIVWMLCNTRKKVVDVSVTVEMTRGLFDFSFFLFAEYLQMQFFPIRQSAHQSSSRFQSHSLEMLFPPDISKLFPIELQYHLQVFCHISNINSACVCFTSAEDSAFIDQPVTGTSLRAFSLQLELQASLLAHSWTNNTIIQFL